MLRSVEAMFRHTALALAFTVVHLPPASAYDSLGDSYPEAHLPGICCFEPMSDGFVAKLCGLYTNDWAPLEQYIRGKKLRLRDRPRVQYRTGVGWRWLTPSAPSEKCASPRPGDASDTARPEYGPPAMPHGCPAALAGALPTLSPEEFAHLRPHAGAEEGPVAGKQEIGTCIEHGGYIWFGLAFYDSEGVTGVGGIGRFDPRTGVVEIRRPRLLLDWSSGALLHDGTWLWLATYRYAEGGDEPAIGVVRYDWANDRLVTEPTAMCGFLAVGIVRLGNALWLASDGGLSRRDDQGRWEHDVFHIGKTPAIAKTTCARVYDLAQKDAQQDSSFDAHVRAFIDARERASTAVDQR